MTAESPREYEPLWHDRSTGLIVFGIIELALGGLCVFLAPMTLLGVLAQQQAVPGSADYAQVIPAVVFYLGLGVFFVVMGVGSVRMRRWARTLMLVSSSVWLAIGVLAMAFLVQLGPRMMEAIAANANPGGRAVAPPPAFLAVMTFTIFAFAAVFYVILPAAFVLFYRSRNVKATCNYRDPHVPWTDRCPAPVLAVSLLQVSVAFSLIATAFSRSPLPWFGTLLTGPLATGLMLSAGALSAWLAWGNYRLQRWAWWLSVAAVAAAAVSGIMTFSTHDMMDLYEASGMPPEQLEVMQRMDVSDTFNMPLWTGISTAVFLGYLAYIRRYYCMPAAGRPPTPGETINEPADGDQAAGDQA